MAHSIIFSRKAFGMISLTTPNGLPVSVPESLEEDISKRFDRATLPEAKKYYEENGYVIVKNVVPHDACEKIRALWDCEVKSTRRHIYRQATAKSERNVLNDKGWVMNPILNLQSINPRHFPGLRTAAVNDVLCSSGLRDCFEAVLGEAPKIVQSMYFEGNSATWEHQDSYYLDSEKTGSMAAAWIALEDIGPMAGRFFVCPGTHRLELEKQNAETNIADHHDVYIKKVVGLMRENKMEIRAPLLEAGDVLFWHAWTIHGSLNSQDSERSRSSITAHAIPSSHRFLQLQTRILDVPVDEINGTRLWRPKDQAKLINRCIMFAESFFPGPFYALKRAAIRFIVK